MTSRLSLGRLQQPLQPPLPELLQLVLQQLPVVPPRQVPRPELEQPVVTPVVLVDHRVAMQVRLQTSTQITKSLKTDVAVAVTAGESGVVAG